MRKEFFALSNLCRLPLTINLNKSSKQPQEILRKPNRPLSLPSSEIKRCKKRDSNRQVIVPIKRQSPKSSDKAVSDTNNNTKALRKLPPTSKPNYVKSTKLPEPCKTCGRSDQPERLHSHPTTSVRSVKRTMEVPVKNTVQKPMAMKYQSKKAVSPTKKPQVKPVVKSEVQTRPNSSKRTLTCYLCSREFGTASLPLHEPKCLEVRALDGSTD